MTANPLRIEYGHWSDENFVEIGVRCEQPLSHRQFVANMRVTREEASLAHPSLVRQWYRRLRSNLLDTIHLNLEGAHHE